MNYFAHGFRFIDQPYFLAGTAVPDWLNVVDRKVRARSKGAKQLLNAADPQIAAVAAGIVQHHHDDDWFHRTQAFAELSLQFTVAIRNALPADNGLRPSFLGHILVELLLDAQLSSELSSQLDRYYAAMRKINPDKVQAAVNQIASRQTTQLPYFIERFCEIRFLFDYADDEKLLHRLNQVMRRVGLSRLPALLATHFSDFRRSVSDRRDELFPYSQSPT